MSYDTISPASRHVLCLDPSYLTKDKGNSRLTTAYLTRQHKGIEVAGLLVQAGTNDDCLLLIEGATCVFCSAAQGGLRHTLGTAAVLILLSAYTPGRLDNGCKVVVAKINEMYTKLRILLDSYHKVRSACISRS